MGDQGIDAPHRMPAALTWWKRKGVMTWCVACQGMWHRERGQGVRSDTSERRQNKNKKKGLTRQIGTVCWGLDMARCAACRGRGRERVVIAGASVVVGTRCRGWEQQRRGDWPSKTRMSISKGKQ